jgi:ribosome-associated protein
LERAIKKSTDSTGMSQTNAAADDAARGLALRIAELISDSPASNTLVLDVRGLSSFADYFVVCSGENERQLQAVVNHIAEGLAEDGIKSKRVEGSAIAGWILLDFGDVIVHIFDVEQRAYYRLESLWSDAPTLLAIQ